MPKWGPGWAGDNAWEAGETSKTIRNNAMNGPRELLLLESDRTDAAGDDGLPFRVELHVEADVNAADFEETSAERTSGESCRGVFRKELAAAHEHFSGIGRDNGDFVQIVFGMNRQFAEIVQGLKLDTVF